MLNEQQVNIQARHHVFLQRLGSGEVNKFLPILKELRRGILLRLSGDLTEFSRTRLEAQLASIMKFQREIFGSYINDLNESLLEIVLNESSFEQKALAKSLLADAGFSVSAPASAQLFAALKTIPLNVGVNGSGKLLESFIKDWSTSQMNTVNGIIRQGWAEGQTVSQISKGIGDHIQSNLRRTNEAIVRTAINHVSQTARNITWQANDDITIGWRFLAVLDGRTSEICAGIHSLDKVYDIGKGPYPPRHINCRSTSIPELDGRYANNNADFTQASNMPKAKGQVDANLTYYEVLKRQPKQFVYDTIGKAKGELLLSGKMSAKEFAEFGLNSRFEPLTLTEMIEKDKRLNLGLFD